MARVPCRHNSLRSEDTDEQRFVLTRSRRDLSTVGCLAVGIFERGQAAEPAFEIHFLQAFDGKRVADAGGARVVPLGGRRRGDIEVGERRQRLGQRRIGQRRRGHGSERLIRRDGRQIEALDRLQRPAKLRIERRELGFEFRIRYDRRTRIRIRGGRLLPMRGSRQRQRSRRGPRQ
jgi:hypothetical protein